MGILKGVSTYMYTYTSMCMCIHMRTFSGASVVTVSVPFSCAGGASDEVAVVGVAVGGAVFLAFSFSISTASSSVIYMCI